MHHSYIMKMATKKSTRRGVGHERKKKEFIGLASHQLRTPLTTINWYVEMLRSGDAGKLNTAQKKYLKEVDSGVHYMVRLINGLLEITNAEQGCVTICAPSARGVVPASQRVRHHRTAKRV